MTRAAVVAEAREWLGTPFMHQQNLKGVGCDCGGLLRGVSVALGLIPADFKSRIPSDLMGYARVPDGAMAIALCNRFLEPIPFDDIGAGDLVVIRWGEHPQHSAIVADGPYERTLIHALGPGRPNKVVETSMRWLTSASARGPKFVQAYHVPGVER